MLISKAEPGTGATLGHIVTRAHLTQAYRPDTEAIGQIFETD